MLSGLRKFRKFIVTALEYVVMAVMAFLVIDVVFQVAVRNITLMRQIFGEIAWTEELATFLLMWVALLGAAVAFARKGHLGVDYFVGKLPESKRIFTETVVYLLISFFAAAAMIYGGYRLVAFTLMTKQVSAALGVKMGYVYLAIPVSGFFIFIISLETVIEDFIKLTAKEKV